MAGIEIRAAAGAGDIEAVRLLWREYWDALGLAPEFQGFAEELRDLPGDYAPPRGLLLIALVDGKAAGTVALRPIDELACEAKRLYVSPAARRCGIGRRLLESVIAGARSLGYWTLYGDTLPSMAEALEMYERLGFRETGPYSASPTPGAIYLRLPLG
jgi:GNAT superfamily N-acetyltransferase